MVPDCREKMHEAECPVLQVFVLSLLTVWQSRGGAGHFPSNTTVQVKEGEAINLLCPASCLPSCHYRWLCTSCRVYPSGSKPVLTLSNVTRDHAGVYRCIAYNTYSRYHANITLDVLYPAQVTDVLFPTNSVAMTTTEEMQVSITCRASGNPPPKRIIWDVPALFSLQNATYETRNFALCTSSITSTQANMSELVLAQFFFRLGHSMSSVLTLTSATCLDNGNFTCGTTNDVWGFHHKSVHLSVRCAPRIDVMSCEPSPERQTVRFSETVVLKLCAAAFPKPRVRWQHATQPLTAGSLTSYDVIDDSVRARLRTEMKIEVRAPETYGSYDVLLENEEGSLSKTFVLEAKEAPWPAENITVYDENETSLCLSWVAGFDGGSAQTFLLTFGAKKDDAAVEPYTTAVVAEKGEKHVARCFKGLNPGTRYQFALSSSNRHGACAPVLFYASTASQGQLRNSSRQYKEETKKIIDEADETEERKENAEKDGKKKDNTKGPGNELLAASMTSWIISAVPGSACVFIALVVFCCLLFIARRRRVEKKPMADRSLTPNTGSGLQTSNNQLQNSSGSENEYTSIEDLQPEYENEGEENGLASGLSEAQSNRLQSPEPPVTAYDALLPFTLPPPGDYQVLPPVCHYIDMTGRPRHDVIADDPVDAYDFVTRVIARAREDDVTGQLAASQSEFQENLGDAKSSRAPRAQKVDEVAFRNARASEGRKESPKCVHAPDQNIYRLAGDADFEEITLENADDWYQNDPGVAIGVYRTQEPRSGSNPNI